MFNNFIIRKSNSTKPHVEIVDKSVNNMIGGILVTIAPLRFYKRKWGFDFFVREDIEYHWKPFASIYGGKPKEAYSKKWYQLKNSITNYSRDMVSGRLQVIETHEDSRSQRYLLLNNIIST